MKNPLIFAIDLDGVLCDISPSYTNYPVAKPIEQNIRKLKLLYSQGHRIIIYTSRPEIDTEVTKKWLNEHLIPYDELRMGKPRADVYVDDLSVPIKEWRDTEY